MRTRSLFGFLALGFALVCAVPQGRAGEEPSVDEQGLEDEPLIEVVPGTIEPEVGEGAKSSGGNTPVLKDAPFAAMAGWWLGQGRLSFKDGKLEQVKCRATYFVEGGGNDLKQTIRCASAGGKIEVTSNVKHQAGKLAGTWLETVYNVSGDITGQVTERGFRVTVKGTEMPLSANMDIMVREKTQIIEIQFFSETLVGLTLVLNKG